MSQLHKRGQILDVMGLAAPIPRPDFLCLPKRKSAKEMHPYRHLLVVFRRLRNSSLRSSDILADYSRKTPRLIDGYMGFERPEI